MPTDRPGIRRQKLLSQIKGEPFEALLVTNETNVGYLTGFTGDSSFLLIGKEICTLISDGRYTTQISQECPDLDVVILAGQNVADPVGSVVPVSSGSARPAVPGDGRQQRARFE